MASDDQRKTLVIPNLIIIRHQFSAKFQSVFVFRTGHEAYSFHCVHADISQSITESSDITYTLEIQSTWWIVCFMTFAREKKTLISPFSTDEWKI